MSYVERLHYNITDTGFSGSLAIPTSFVIHDGTSLGAVTFPGAMVPGLSFNEPGLPDAYFSVSDSVTSKQIFVDLDLEMRIVTNGISRFKTIIVPIVYTGPSPFIEHSVTARLSTSGIFVRENDFAHPLKPMILDYDSNGDNTTHSTIFRTHILDVFQYNVVGTNYARLWFLQFNPKWIDASLLYLNSITNVVALAATADYSLRIVPLGPEFTNVNTMPNVSISGTPTINVTTMPPVVLSGTSSVSVVTMPDVVIGSAQLPLNVTVSNPSLTISSMPPVVVSGPIDVQSLPPVSISGTPSVSVVTLPNVTVSSLPGINVTTMPPVEISNSPEVIVNTLPPVVVSSLPSVVIGNVPHVVVDNVPDVHVTNTPTVNVARSATDSIPVRVLY